MISNCQNSPLKTKQRQLHTCPHKSINSNLPSKISAMAGTVAAATANKNTLVKPPMEDVVVNSIIYSKPSFCGISVDLGDVPAIKRPTTRTKLTSGTCPNNTSCFSETLCSSSIDLKDSYLTFEAASCLTGFAASSSVAVHDDAKLYRMCTTINGSINHQISDLCDNILAMAGICKVTTNEHDDDSFIEFAYRDDGDDDDDEDDCNEEDFIDDEDDEDLDDDYDVVDFSYECTVEPEPKLNCDRKKKVRFNTKPTVHIMHTWNYAYRAARKGEWEMYARDRERFKLRIQRTSLLLNPVLEREYRQKIYDKRFANLYNKDEDQMNVSVEVNDSKKISTIIELKNSHQKKKRKKKRYCKMGNKHYF